MQLADDRFMTVVLLFPLARLLHSLKARDGRPRSCDCCTKVHRNFPYRSMWRNFLQEHHRVRGSGNETDYSNCKTVPGG